VAAEELPTPHGLPVTAGPPLAAAPPPEAAASPPQAAASAAATQAEVQAEFDPLYSPRSQAAPEGPASLAGLAGLAGLAAPPSEEVVPVPVKARDTFIWAESIMGQDFHDVLSRLQRNIPMAILHIPRGSGTDNGGFLFVGFDCGPTGCPL
jgi:hypothetical protein